MSTSQSFLIDLTVEADPSGPWGLAEDLLDYREEVRAALALYLMTLLAVLVLLLLFAAISGWLTTAEVGDLSQPLVTPVVALLGTALGFYFGRSS